MAKVLELPIGTLYRYMNMLAQETRTNRLNKSDTLIHAYYTRVEDIIREIETRYAETKDPKLLRDKADVLHNTYDRLQKAGFIPTADSHLKLGADDDLKSWLKSLSEPKKVTAKR
jgi:hypothetical protein